MWKIPFDVKNICPTGHFKGIVSMCDVYLFLEGENFVSD